MTLTGHWDRAIRKNASKCSSGGSDGKRVKSPPSRTPSHAQCPGGPGQHPKNSQGPRPCTGRPSQSPGNPRVPDPPSRPRDCNPCSQVKSPSSKNSHPSSVPTRQPGWAGRRARQASGTHPGGSSRDEAVARRDRLWEASPGLLTALILWAGGSGPSPKAQRGNQLASPCLPASPARTTGPCMAWRAGFSQEEGHPGASGDGAPPTKTPAPAELPEAGFWRADLARKGELTHPRQKKDTRPRLSGLSQSPWERWKVKKGGQGTDIAPGGFRLIVNKPGPPTAHTHVV